MFPNLSTKTYSKSIKNTVWPCSTDKFLVLFLATSAFLLSMRYSTGLSAIHDIQIYSNSTFIGQTRSAPVLANSAYGNLMNTGKRYHLRHCLRVWHCAQSSKLYIQVLSIPLAIPRLPGFWEFFIRVLILHKLMDHLGTLPLAVSICIMIMLSCSVMHHPAQCLERMTERIFLLAMISFSKIKQQARTAWPILETLSSNNSCEREPCLMPNPLMQWS